MMRNGVNAVAAMATLTLALTLAGCSGKGRQGNSAAAPAEAANTTVTTVPEDDAAPPPSTSATPDNATDAAGDPAPRPSTGPADPPTASPEAAAAVVQRYYADLGRGDFRAAYALWGNDGADSHQSFADFQRGFARTATTSAKIGKPTNGEGAAGSIYIDVPVTIRATLKDGTRQRFTGHYTLRRVNDVPGSTAAQRRWHLSSAALKAG
jgi:hypothetical protein